MTNAMASELNRKIGIITPAKFPGTSGDTANYSEIINELVSEHFSVILVCPANPDSDTKNINSIFPGVTMVTIPQPPTRLAEVKNHIRIKDYLKFILFLLIESITVYRTMSKHRIKYVYLRHSLLTLHIPILLKLMRINTMADGELFSDALENIKLIRYPVLKVLRVYEYSILRFYRKFRVSTSNQFKRLEKIGFQPEKIVLIPISINTAKIPKIPINSIPPHTFGYFGTLEAWQGVDILLKSFKLLLEKIPNATLYIIGDGSLRPSLMDLADDLKIRSNVIFVRGIPRELIWKKYFSKFRILVVPRPRLNNTYDSLPSLKIIEALASGKPVIATDIPAMRDLSNEIVYVVPPNDFSSLSSAMELLSKDEVQLLSRSSKALSYVQKYDITRNMARFIESLYG